MKSQFFMDLIYTLREYKEGKFTKMDMMKLYQEWIDKGIIDEKELISLTGDTFYAFYSDIMGVSRNLKTRKVEEVAKPAIDFIDTFDEDDNMPKKQLAILCERSEQWLSGYKDKFENDRTGANVVSFLRWLKVKDFQVYKTFKKNYK